MKAGQSLRLSVLRMLISAANYKQIDAHRDLTDEEVLGVISNEAKKRREAIDSFKAAQREEQAAKEQQELDILAAYLPKQLTEEEIRGEIGKLDLGTDFGQAMRVASPLFRGRADGSLVAKLVKEKLGNG